MKIKVMAASIGAAGMLLAGLGATTAASATPASASRAPVIYANLRKLAEPQG